MTLLHFGTHPVFFMDVKEGKGEWTGEVPP